MAPLTIRFPEAASRSTSLSNERDAYSSDHEQARPENAENPQKEETAEDRGDTTVPPITASTGTAEQQSRPSEDPNMASLSDIEPPEPGKQTGSEEPFDNAEAVKRPRNVSSDPSQNLDDNHVAHMTRQEMHDKAFGDFERNMLRIQENMTFGARSEYGHHVAYGLQSYIRLLEKRLLSLEEDHRRRFGDGERPHREDTSTDTNSKAIVPEGENVSKTIPMVNRVPWAMFKRKYDDKTCMNRVHAIDVLVGEAVIPHEVWRDRATGKMPEHLFERERRLRAYEAWISVAQGGGPLPKQPQQDQANANPQKEPMPSERPVEASEDDYPSVPERIRINGEPLKQLLESALDVDFMCPGSPVVMLRPFKLLVLNKDRIYKLYTRLKEKFSNTEIETTDRIDADGDNGNVVEKHGTKQAYMELQCLIDFMETDLRALKNLEEGSVKRIAFSELWHIFQPGVEVINRAGEKPVGARRVLHTTGGRPYLSPPEDNDMMTGKKAPAKWYYEPPEKSSDFIVNCFQIDFNGYAFGPIAESFNIEKFDGLKDITELRIYPLRFAENETTVREMLLDNGKKFLDVCKTGHVLYHGPNLHEKEEINSEVILDFQAALSEKQDKDQEEWTYYVRFGLQRPATANIAEVVMVSSGGCKECDCCENDVIFDDLNLDHRQFVNFLGENPWLTKNSRDDDRDRIPKEDLILMQTELFAFVPKDRKWATVDINHITKLSEPTREAWDSLVLPRGHKSMVYSLVQSHFRERQNAGADNETQADLVRGKGKGLIILLHGAPGVGKTSTAECLAEICGQPLYPITCGDLGITAGEVETKLKRIFVQAQKWKCVLLLDEADVFLSERGNNVKHNSLVSVFLRVLEYYHGILFLTTNRVGRLDEAFRSRVHLSLYYPPLDRKSTIEIFKSNLQRIAQHKKGAMKIREDEILDFAKDHYKFNKPRVRWNGRQIRNAFHIAVALAENDAIEHDGAKAETAPGENKGDGEGRPPRKPKLRARHFEVVEGASSKFDEYLTSVLGMAQAERMRLESYRKDDWKYAEERVGQDEKRRASRRRRRKFYSSDDTDSEDDGGEAPLRQPKVSVGVSDDGSSDSQPERPRRRRTMTVTDSDSSDEQLTARQRRRAAEKQKSRDDEKKTDRSRKKDRERE